MSYADTQREILAVKPRTDRRRELLRRSDALLQQLESLNLVKYGALKAWSNLEAVRLTHDLVAAINELLVEVGLPTRRLTTTTQALDAVFEAQSVIFHRHPDDQEEDQPCDS